MIQNGMFNQGRLLEALVEFYIVTGSKAALRLAERIATFHFDLITRPEGSEPQAEFMHTTAFGYLPRTIALRPADAYIVDATCAG